MTKKELYNASEILNEILDNYLHGGEAAEVVAKFEDALEKRYLGKVEPINEDFEKSLAECIHQAQYSVVDPLVHAQIWKNELIGLAKGENVVSNDLDTATKEWLKPQLDVSYEPYGEDKMMEMTKFDGYSMLEAAVFGAKWQKERDKNLLDREFSAGYTEGHLAELSQSTIDTIREEYKQKLMKDAVESEVVITSKGILLTDLRTEDFDYADKAKLIIIKDK